MGSFSHAQYLADVEREHILKIVAQCGGNRTHAAKILGISIRGLRIKLLRYADIGAHVPLPDQKRAGSPLWDVSQLGSLTLDG